VVAATLLGFRSAVATAICRARIRLTPLRAKREAGLFLGGTRPTTQMIPGLHRGLSASPGVKTGALSFRGSAGPR